MASNTLLNVFTNLENHGQYYDFLYDDLQKIIEHGEHKGHTQVRFVSRSLRGQRDTQFRHVFLEFRQQQQNQHKNKPWMNSRLYISEHNPYWARNNNNNNNKKTLYYRDEISILLPNVTHDMRKIIDHEEGFPGMYVLGVRDCRHHVSDMLSFCYPDVLLTTD